MVLFVPAGVDHDAIECRHQDENETFPVCPFRMSLRDLCWLATATYALHAIEELMFDWRGWARAVLKLPVEWNFFYFTNAAVMVFGIVAANLADSSPAIALAFPAVMIVNTIFFHVLPFVVTRGRFSPGLITAIALFLPVGFWSYRTASRSGVLSSEVLWISVVLGALVMAFPIILLRVSKRAYFQQV
jgi:hypothetical protein